MIKFRDFLVFASKIASILRLKSTEALCADNWDFLAVVQIEKNSLYCFCKIAMLQKQKKSVFSSCQTEKSKLCSFVNVVVKIDIDALKIAEQTNEIKNWQ